MLYKVPHVYEPKRKNRFVLRFPSDLGVQEWTVESTKRPSISQNPVQIPFLNTSTWVLGRYTWDDMQVTLRDMIGPSTMQAVMEWVRLHSESVSGRQGYAAGYQRDIELEMLDPTGVIIEKWICKNCWITNMDGGDLGHSDDNLANITLTLKMDYAILVY